MIKFEQAYKIVMQTSVKIKTEEIALQNSLGRVLAADVFSDMNMPPFDKSAMDGFACRYEDLYNELEIIEVIPAGKLPEKQIGKNQCAKIMTGAPLPINADTVFIVEHSRETKNDKVFYTKKRTDIDICNIEKKLSKKSNICYTGEDVKKGEIVLSKGTIIEAQHIAIMASVGCVRPLVSRQVKVGVIATGSELVEPHNVPSNSQIRNSNGLQTVSQLININVIANYYGIAKDDELITYNIIKKAKNENDIVMISGGVSMGDFDFVPHILKKLDFEIKFDRVAVQPGKPTTFATTGKNKFCFGMPGNPVSSFVQFELLAKPFIYKLMGADFKANNIVMPLAREYSRKRDKRLSWIPIKFTNKGEIMPIEYHGSAHINGLAIADGIISVPIGTKILTKGTLVNVRPI